MANKPPQTPKQLNNPVGFWPRPPKRADKAIKYLVSMYNERNKSQEIDLSLTAFIMIVIRLYDSVKKDPSFTGGYNEAAKLIRRHLFNHLNLCVLYKDDGQDDAEELED